VSDEAPKVRLIVTDTSPLITLAAAGTLDYLLYPGVPVYLPDAVLYEATINSAALGADNIAAWAEAHPGEVVSITTQTFADFLTLRELNPEHRERDLGERAALHALRHGVKLAPDERAILLTEDDRVLRGSFIVAPEDKERMILMTTRDFLVALEAAGRINSADEVYRTVEDAGRASSRREVLQDQHQTAIAAVERVMRRRPSDTEPKT
jgi:hypothetical protein